MFLILYFLGQWALEIDLGFLRCLKIYPFMYDIALIIRVFINNEIQKQLKTKIKLIQYIILYMFLDQKRYN